MERAFALGRPLFAAAVAFLGLQQLLLRDFVPGVFAAPAWLPARAPLAIASGLVLTAAAAGLAWSRRPRLPALVLAAVLALFFVVFDLSAPATLVSNPVARTRAAETLALLALALLLAERGRLGSLLFAAAMVVFGVQHFLYARFVAALVPAWIPLPLVWAYASGAGMVAAAIAFATQLGARAAAAMLGCMFLLWVPLLHAPRVAAHLGDAGEWNSAAVALAMGGAAWIVAALSPRPESTAVAPRQPLIPST